MTARGSPSSETCAASAVTAALSSGTASRTGNRPGDDGEVAHHHLNVCRPLHAFRLTGVHEPPARSGDVRVEASTSGRRYFGSCRVPGFGSFQRSAWSFSHYYDI